MSAPARTALHLVRPRAAPLAVAPADWVVYLDPLELAPPGPTAPPPPVPAGRIDHEQLIALTFAADLVITW